MFHMYQNMVLLIQDFVAKATRRVRYVKECGYRHNACFIVNICIQCWIHIWPIIMQGYHPVDFFLFCVVKIFKTSQHVYKISFTRLNIG